MQIITLFIYTTPLMHISMLACWPADKICMKRHLEFENNAIGCMTFTGQPACWPGPLYML